MPTVPARPVDSTGSQSLTDSRGSADGSILQDNTVQDLDKLLTQSRGMRSRYEGAWNLNLAFYLGDQWLFWNKNRLDRPQLDPWRVTLVDNRILGVVRTELAKMTKQQPTFQVIPTTADDADIQASETGEKILDYLWRHLHLRNKLTDALLWSRVCSAGFWKVCWDPTKGQSVDIVCDGNGKPILHATTGGPIRVQDMGSIPDGMGSKTVCTGDVSVEVLTPFDVFPDPIARELEDCEWLIQETVKSSEYVFKHFGERVSPDTDVATGPAETRMAPGFQMGTASGYRGVKLREYWCKPNSQHPQGKHTVWAKSKILYDGPNPYTDLPYVMFKGVPVPGRFWPTSLAEQLRGPQTELNKVKSQITENANRIGNPALLASRQANVNYSGVPGERIDYDDTVPNAIPTYLDPPSMPQYVLQQQDRIVDSIEQISGQHEVSNAQVPAGVTAASAINLLLEADDTRLGPAIYEMEENIALAGQKLLKLVASYWTDQRTIMIAGEDHAWDVMAFKGDALKENTRVEVQAGSAFPRSKAAKQAAIQQMLNLVIQNPQMGVAPSNIRKVLRDMEAGGLERFFDDMSTDEAQVNRENQRLAQGQMFDINSFDNHEAHIEIHTDFQKGASYLLLPQPWQQQIEAHVNQHRMQMMAAQVPQGAAFQPGEPPPPGSPPPPGVLPDQPEEGSLVPPSPEGPPIAGAPMPVASPQLPPS